MKRVLFLVSAISILLMAVSFAGNKTGKSDVTYLKGSYKANWRSLAKHETPQWYKDAVIGIYFHWGPYSVPGFGCWGGRNMYMPEGGSSENWGDGDSTTIVSGLWYCRYLPATTN